jgi:MFS family permease
MDRVVAELNIVQKKRRLPFALAGDSAGSIFGMLSIFGPVFLLFLDQLGLDKKRIGLLLSLFPFCGLMAPLIGPWLSRVGLKRTFLTFWTLRKLAILSLALTPWVVKGWGSAGAFGFVATAVLVFALCRAVGETALYPWSQEFVPASYRGRFAAMDNILIALFSGIATFAAARIIGANPDLWRFSIVFAIAFVFGMICVVAYSFLPGGAPQPPDGQRENLSITAALRDPAFMRYMAGLGLVLLGAGIGTTFVPLFMTERLALTASQVLMLQTISLLSGLISSFGWGWASDRYGSKPIFIVGLLLASIYPLGLLMMPRAQAGTLPLATALTVLVGIMSPGWTIGSSRYLFVSMVPAKRKTSYLSLYYAWIGLVGGVGPLIAGQIIDLGPTLRRTAGGIILDAYAWTFIIHIVLVGAGVWLFRRLSDSGSMAPMQFVGLFLRGNPISAVTSMISHSRARGEKARILTTESLAYSRSPLTVDQLLGALDDPSYNVRFEAIVAMARTRPDDRLTDALIAVLLGPEADLSVAAALALGRIGDARAIEPLRQTLLSEFPMLAARSARSLGLLGDQQVAPLLLARFRDELNLGMRVAYASALGALRVRAALLEIMVFFRQVQGQRQRWELALAIAQMAGDHAGFVQLWRQWRSEPHATISEALSAVARRCSHDPQGIATAVDLESCAAAAAEEDWPRVAKLLVPIINQPSMKTAEGSPAFIILRECQDRLSETAVRDEYILLAVYMMDVDSTQKSTSPNRVAKGI